MAANQSLYQMEHPARAEEWVDFNNSFEFATGYLESNAPSLDSISPKDLELVYSDADALNWDSEAAQWPQSAFSDLVTFEDPLIGSTEMPLDMVGFSETVPPPPSFPEVGAPASIFDDTWSSFDASNMAEESFCSPSAYRQLIESQATADPRCFSKKEKRLEASIALHLQRLQDVATADLNLSSDSWGSFSSPCWPDSAGSASESQSRGSPSSTSPSEHFAKSSTPPSSRPSPLSGGVELVLDLNMNTTTNLPKKQKPRSQAQKENYIKVRKHGACEKHRKQHKRCNCLDKSASRVLNDSAVAALAQCTKARLEVRNTGQNVATKLLSTSTLPTLPPIVSDRARAVKAVPGSVQPITPISPTVKANVQRVERTVHTSAGRVTAVIPPTISTNVQPSARSAHSSAGRANTAVSWTHTANASVMERIVQNSGGRAVISVKSPANVQPSERWAQSSAGQQNTAHAHIRDCQSPKEARPWRAVDHTSSVPGPLVTQNTQTVTAVFRGRQDGAVRAVHFTPGLLRESSGVLRPFRYRPTFQQDVGKPVESQSTQTNEHAKGKENFWFNSQTWSLPGSQAAVIQTSTVVEYAGAVIRNTALAFSAFWQSSTSLTSWAGVLLGRLVLSSSRQHILAKKGMGLA